MMSWREEYSVGVASLDTDHKVLISMINQLEEALTSGEPTKFINDVLDALSDYTDYHFAREEDLMRAAGYPDIDAHARSHQTLAAQVHDIRARYRRNPASVHFREIVSFLNNWLTTHIVGRDLKYAAHLANGEHAVETAESSLDAGSAVTTDIPIKAGQAR